MSHTHQCATNMSLDSTFRDCHHLLRQRYPFRILLSDHTKGRLMMILQHDATLSWFVDGPLASCRARLWRARRAGHLTVSSGRVWVTRAGDLDDHVLEA